MRAPAPAHAHTHSWHTRRIGLSYVDCLEKSDLVSRAKEAVAVLVARGEHPGAAAHPAAAASTAAATPRKPAGGPMTEKRVKLGGYDCVLKGNAACLAGKHVPDMAVVILHG